MKNLKAAFLLVLLFSGACVYETGEDLLDGTACQEVSFSQTIQPLIQRSCAINNEDCHSPGDSQPDFTVFANVERFAHDRLGGIRQRVLSGDMPRGNRSLSQEEIENIVCWIDNGALQN